MTRTPDSYSLEKVNFSLFNLTGALEMLRRENPNLEEIESNILGAISDLAKVASRNTASDTWQTTDYQIIEEKLFEGLEELQMRWGYISETTKERDAREKNEIIERQRGRFRAILEGGETSSPTRTLLYEYLQSEDQLEPALLTFQDLLEDVTMGKMSWAEFRVEALEWLETSTSPESK